MYRKERIRISGAVLLTVILTSLCGCSFLKEKSGYFRDNTVDYVLAEEGKALTLPASTPAASSQTIMPIPSVAHSKAGNEAGIVPNNIPPPAGITMFAGDAFYRIAAISAGHAIESNAGDRLLQVRLKNFLKDGNIPVAISEASVLETDWFIPAKQAKNSQWVKFIKKSASIKKPLKLRFELHSSPDKGNSVITILALKKHVKSAGKDGHDGVDTSLLPAVKQNLLVYLVEHSGEQIDSTINGQSGSEKMLVSMDNKNGNTVLKLTGHFDTAWQVIGSALEHSGIKVAQKNHTAGIYYITLPEAVNGEHTANREGQHAIMKKALAETDRDSHRKEHVYRLVLTPADNNDSIYVSLEKDMNAMASAEFSKVVLSQIKAHC